MSLIEREAAKAKKVYCEERHEYVVPVAELDWLPTIEAAPVVHGNWKTIRCSGTYTGGGDPVWGCTKCGYMYGASLRPPKFAFCPSCGAWMDGGKDDG